MLFVMCFLGLHPNLLGEPLITQHASLLLQVSYTLVSLTFHTYNSLKSDYKEPTEEEMEAFRMKRKRPEDPMSHFLS